MPSGLILLCNVRRVSCSQFRLCWKSLSCLASVWTGVWRPLAQRSPWISWAPFPLRFFWPSFLRAPLPCGVSRERRGGRFRRCVCGGVLTPQSSAAGAAAGNHAQWTRSRKLRLSSLATVTMSPLPSLSDVPRRGSIFILCARYSADLFNLKIHV